MLAVRLSSLGDVVLALSAVELLHRRRPDVEIDFLTREAYRPVVDGHPAVARVLGEDGGSGDPRPSGTYGRVLDLQGGAKGRAAARRHAPEAPRTSYPRAALRRRLLVAAGRRVGAAEPLVVRFGRAIAGRRVPLDRLQPHRPVGEDARVQAARALSRGGPERWALVAPGASRRLKAIPDALCDQVEEALLGRGWGIVRLLAPAADPAPRGWVAADGARRAFRGDLPAVMALTAAVGVVISSDSGILHLATALDVPAVGLFGPTVPELGFSPLGRSRVVGVDLACRPCHVHGPKFCWLGHQRCWRDQQVTAVLSAVEEVVANACGGPAVGGADVGAGRPTNKSAQSGTDEGAQSGTDDDARSGPDEGAQSGTDQGAQSGTSG